MKIAIVGTSVSDVTEFVNGVLFGSLIKPEHKEYGFEIREVNEQGVQMMTAYRGGAPTVHIQTFATPEAAARWLMGLP